MSNKTIITAMPFIEEASPGEFNVEIPQEVIGQPPTTKVMSL